MAISREYPQVLVKLPETSVWTHYKLPKTVFTLPRRSQRQVTYPGPDDSHVANLSVGVPPKLNYVDLDGSNVLLSPDATMVARNVEVPEPRT